MRKGSVEKCPRTKPMSSIREVVESSKNQLQLNSDYSGGCESLFFFIRKKKLIRNIKNKSRKKQQQQNAKEKKYIK